MRIYKNKEFHRWAKKIAIHFLSKSGWKFTAIAETFIKSLYSEIKWSCDRTGATPSIVAVACGQIKAVKLFSQICLVNIRHNIHVGSSVHLSTAAMNGHNDIIKLLWKVVEHDVDEEDLISAINSCNTLAIEPCNTFETIKLLIDLYGHEKAIAGISNYVDKRRFIARCTRLFSKRKN